ncbi:EAL domain-containing protein [Marinobacterium sp. BA1]|uniref:EAL domain-containing protein n=1 Tax=Marinobacterium sp. BA1 TaxID=3138931 RepID=UPI0034E87FE6
MSTPPPLPSATLMAAERAELEQILRLELLEPVFQPIMDLRSGTAIGHEALIRGPRGSTLYAPSRLFQAAIRHDHQLQLELLCRKCSLARFAELKPGGLLFLNVTASLLSSPDHQHGFTADLLRQLDIPLESIVIELSEQHPFDHQGLTRAAVEHYRSMGFQIAIDDLGAGYSGLRLWSELQPEFVKIDKHFISDLDRDPVKREFVQSIGRIGRNLRCQILAEGIERYEEMRALQQMGIGLGQGFLLGMPSTCPQPLLRPDQIRRPLHVRSGQAARQLFHLMRQPMQRLRG